MIISPVAETEATPEVKVSYQRLKEGLGVPSVPLFFQYFGGFPEYLEYVTEQITKNLTSDEFGKIIAEDSFHIESLTKDGLTKSEDLHKWLALYSASPSFYNFQHDLTKILETNLKIAFIFISIREAIKGWALAAKKLQAETKTTTAQEIATEEGDFVFDDFLSEKQVIVGSDTQEKSIMSSVTTAALTTKQSQDIEKNLLVDYLQLCRFEFAREMKSTSFWTLRIGIEKIILSNLNNLPSLIFSPINLFINMNKKYPNYSELLYLLSEHFPTYAVQRLLFSAFLIEKKG